MSTTQKSVYNRKKIAFIGVGNMANAILSGITSVPEDPVSYEDIWLFNRHPEKIEPYRSLGAHLPHSLEEAVENADCVILAVKPQNFPEILPLIRKTPKASEKLYVTIAAGITTESVADAIAGENSALRVIRVLPNTPMLIGMGVSAICKNQFVTDADFAFVRKLFDSAGKTIMVEESEMNRMISVTSSSPAYVYSFIESLYAGAVAQGLPEAGLMDAICDTVVGAATHLKNSGRSPAELIRTVTSKGGTTERAMQTLERYSFRQGLIEAMQNCTARAEELGKGN